MNLSSPLWHSLRQTTYRAYPPSVPALFLFARRQSTAANTPPKPKPLLPNFLVTPNVLNGALLTQTYDASKNPAAAAAAPRIVPVCATWFMPNDARKRTGLASFLTVRIPGARFLDIDAVCDRSSEYPHMLPTAPEFAKAMCKLGLRPDDTVVCYDDAEVGIFSAPRAAWMFKVFGQRCVHVLNNFKLWVDHGFPVEKGEPVPAVEETVYPVPVLDKSRVMYHDDLVPLITDRLETEKMDLTIVDARSRGRWEGTEPEPRKGLQNGHIPRSINIPYTDVLNARTKAFLSAAELRVYFECKGVDPKKPVVSTCGTGVTACVLDAALTEAGYPETDRKVYDGSWTEWASRQADVKGMIRTGKI